MKIKKKEYEKTLRDEYWRGVEAGIKFAQRNPDMAQDFNISKIRATSEMATKALVKLGEGLREVFKER